MNFVVSNFNTIDGCFSLTALNMSWCSLDSECMTLLCKTLPTSITRLNIAGCRKTMTDESKYNEIYHLLAVACISF